MMLMKVKTLKKTKKKVGKTWVMPMLRWMKN